MSNPPTCMDSHSATSSPVSASGASHFVAPAGQMTDLFGLVPVRANLTPRQAKDLGLLTSGTYGQPGTGSSESANLSKSLASKFRTPLSMAGSISSDLTWKERVTPSGRCYFDLQTLVPRSRGSGPTLLPTVSAREWRDRSQAQILARLDRGDGVAKRICALSLKLRSSPEIVGLNPSFAAWTMGLPSAWVDCMPSATRSTPKQRVSSSKP